MLIFNQGGERTNGMGKEKYGMEKLPKLLADVKVTCSNSIYCMELKYCYEQGIVPQYTTPWTPEQIGLSERRNWGMLKCGLLNKVGLSLFQNASWA